LTAFPLKILDKVSIIGSGAGIAAYSRRGSTSKGTKVSNLYKYFKYFFNNSGNLWAPPHVYIPYHIKQSPKNNHLSATPCSEPMFARFEDWNSDISPLSSQHKKAITCPCVRST